MEAIVQDPKRDQREQERQARFKVKFVEETPPWYHGAMHLGFMLVVTLGTIWYCATQLDNPGFWD
ncbi:MAG: fatty acid hydroxylase family protein, partial [Beijerinckiaceae bacterium]